MVSGNVPRFEDSLRALSVDSRKKLRDLAPYHLRNHLPLVQVAGGLGGHSSSIAQNGDAVAKAEDLFQPMRDINDSYSVGPEARQNSEQTFGLGISERCGGLIEHENFGFVRQRLGDFDKLLPAGPQFSGGTARINVYAEPG